MLWPALLNENYSWRRSLSSSPATAEVWAVNVINSSPYLSSNHKTLVSIITENKNVCVLTKQQFLHLTASLKDPRCVVSCLFLSLEFLVVSPSGWGIQVCPWGTFLRIWASVSSFRKFCDLCLACFTGLLWRWDSTKERVRRFKALCRWRAWSWWSWCRVVKWERRAWILESHVFKSKVCHLRAASFTSSGLSPQVWNGGVCPPGRWLWRLNGIQNVKCLQLWVANLSKRSRNCCYYYYFFYLSLCLKCCRCPTYAFVDDVVH